MNSQLPLDFTRPVEPVRKLPSFPQEVTPVFSSPSGMLFEMDAQEFLESAPSGCVDLVFADPPYNISKAEWDNFASQDDYIRWSTNWIREAARVLKPHGSLFICGFSEILADLKRPAMNFFRKCRWLIWSYRNKANLGSDWGRSHESVLLLRKSDKFVMNTDAARIPYSRHTLKYPVHPQAESSQYANKNRNADLWRPHPDGAKPKDVIEIPTTCNGMNEKTPHPTQKPEELLRKLILAASNAGDIVLDPFSGSGTTLTAAEQLGRRWLGCDNNPEYNRWAIARINNAARKSEAEWLEYDRKNQLRRNSIR